MNIRERRLALAVGGLLLLLALWVPYGWYTSGITQRQAQINELQKKVDDQKLKLARGKRAQQKIVALEERSLPYDKQNPELARALYQTWLLAVVDKAGLKEPKVNPLPAQDRGAYQAHAFTVSGRASLAQLTKLLHEFYSAPHLHAVRSLRVRPLKDQTKELELALTLEAISLPGASGVKTLPTGTGGALAVADLKTYLHEIVGRNLFGPPNAPPKLAAPGAQRAYVGKSFSFTAKATDSDKEDTLTYTLEPGAPAGARIDAKSGEFRFTPTATGTVRATLRVADSGTPSKTDTAVVEISVTDPPPPPPEKPVVEAPKKPSFDAAKHTYVTTIAQDREGLWVVWLKVRTTDQTLKLHEGDKFEVGGFKGEVLRISPQDVELRDASRRLLVALGENLEQAIPLPPGDL